MYYACLERKMTGKEQDGFVAVVKIPFETREEAREYISTHYDPEFHSKCWTE